MDARADTASESDPTVRDYRAAVSSPEDRQPLAALIGGPRGALESILPPVVFVAVYVGLGDNNPDSLTWAIVAALLLAAVFGVWRLHPEMRFERSEESLRLAPT